MKFAKKEKDVYQQEIQFTREEMEIIDKLLEEADELQIKNGNRLYTDEEVWGPVLGEIYYKQLSNKI